MQSVFVIGITLLFGIMQVNGQAKTLQNDEQQAQYVPLIINQTTEPLIINQTTEPFIINQTTESLINNQTTQPLINNQTTDCVRIVRCEEIDMGDWSECRLSLHINRSEPECKISFADNAETDIIALHIYGELAALPDAIDKFEKLTELNLEGVRLERVERAKLAPFRRIDFLDLSGNLISELVADTFADLQDLSRLNLHLNKLKTIHRDVFQGLHNLTAINLNYNQLEIIPEGLFRHNHILKYIWLNGNEIRKIECNFYGFPHLIYLSLYRNVCIDKLCDVRSFCGTTSSIAMHKMIWNKCPYK